MKFSYVISYRSDEDNRAAILRAVLRWLALGLPDVEVILVEQDRSSRVSAQDLPPNCQHVFIRNDGAFNKSWAYNVGFKRCSGAVVGFGDADLIMDARSLLDSFERCHAGLDAVKPYDKLIDLTREESHLVLHGNLDIRVERALALPNREGAGENICFGGGLFLIKRECFEQLGGFDENFRGWGGEDDAMTAKLRRQSSKTAVVKNQTIYHLFHERASPHLNPHYRRNLEILQEYARASDDSFRAMCASHRQTIGDSDKYAREMASLPIAQMLEMARRHQRAREFRQADQLYQQILQVDSRHVVALHLSGVLAHQTGNNDLAIRLICQALSLQPEYFEALHNLGQILRLERKPGEALACFQRALQLEPNCAEARNNLGAVLEILGRLEEARAGYQEAVRLKPGYAEAHNNLGNVLKDQRRFAQAEASLREALRLQPDYADAHNNLGTTLMAQGRLVEAAASFSAAVRLKPNHALAHDNLGQALHDQGKVEEAALSFRQAARLKPDLIRAHDNLAHALLALNKLQDAEDACRTLLRLKPDRAETYSLLAIVLLVQQRPDDALAACQEALRVRPDLAIVYNTLGNVFKDLGRLEESRVAYRAALKLTPDDAALHSNLVYASSFHPGCDAATLREEARLWNEQHAAPLEGFIQPHSNVRHPDRKLRIGYVSADFRAHAATLFTTPLLGNHDHQQFEIFCYANNAQSDVHTARLRGYADVWRPIVRLSNPQVVELVRKDRIDILVDLSMHMADNRALVFARKPAPIQVAWLAYPGTTGLSTMDYRLTDPYLDPPGLHDAFYTEQSIRLPDTFWCYDPLSAEPPVNALPAERNGFLTFGCLNYFAKVNDGTLTVWAKVLRAVPQSRLLLMAPEGSARKRVLYQLGQEGVDAGRIQFTGRRRRIPYLHLYHDIDIGLDLLPANGHTTSLDAFWMGVPTPTLVGKTAVGRAGWSQLCNLDLGELAAETPPQYVEMVARLALDLPSLSELRSTLRKRMSSSPLMDAQRFTRNMEQAFRQMWRAWCAPANTCRTMESPAMSPRDTL